MDKQNKLFASIGICFTAVLTIAFVLTCAGLIDLRIVGEIKIDPKLNAVADFVMFAINIFFWFSFALCVFDKRMIYAILAYIPIYIVSVQLINADNAMIFNSLIPIIYIVSTARLRFKDELIKIILRMNLWVIIVSPYQQIGKYIKMSNPNFLYSDYNILTKFIYSIDLYLFYILMHWVVMKYVESPFRPFRFLKSYCQEILAESRRNKEDVSDLTIKQRRVFCLLAWAYVIIQPFIVLGANVLVNKFFHFLGGFYMGAVELVISWIALELCRLSLGKTFHSKNPIICNAVSLAVFFAISRLGIPLHISLFFNIALVAIMALAIHRLVLGKYEFDCLKLYKQRHDEFSLKTCTEDVLRERCRLHGLSVEDTELSIKLFVDKISADAAAEIYNMEVQSIRNKKYRLSKRLNSMI